MYTCLVLAKALKTLMTIANFSGFMNKSDDGKMQQFHPGEITDFGIAAMLELDFGGEKFKIVIAGGDEK